MFRKTSQLLSPGKQVGFIMYIMTINDNDNDNDNIDSAINNTLYNTNTK